MTTKPETMSDAEWQHRERMHKAAENFDWDAYRSDPPRTRPEILVQFKTSSEDGTSVREARLWQTLLLCIVFYCMWNDTAALPWAVGFALGALYCMAEFQR